MTATEALVVHGMGHSIKRKEDPMLIRGRGNYVDDIKLPGMLFLDFVRSPYAHAKIKSINAEKAKALPGVIAVITGDDLKGLGLDWIPTLGGDKMMVLPTEKVVFQMQEVVGVVAEDRYVAADAVNLIEVEYEPLPVVTDPFKALEKDAPIIRNDKGTNHIFHWEVGDRAATDKIFEEADVTVKQDLYYPRIHVSYMETCGCVADFNSVEGHLTLYMTTQAPHAVRTVASLVTKIPENKIRIVSPDIGGGFGGKVYVYPGYIVAAVGSIVSGHPVKWINDRSDDQPSTAFGRDFHMRAELAAKKDGTILAIRVKTISDHGAFHGDANPTKFPVGLFSICTGSYDLKGAFAEVDAAYTNKPQGGITYRCSFRVTEAVYVIERMVDVLAHKVGMDPAEIRMKNFIPKEKFPYKSALGWTYDSGNYKDALKKAMDKIGYSDLRREQEEKRKKGELMGIGISSFTEIVGAGPSHDFDILGLKMFDSAEIRIHPTGKVIARFGTKSQGQGHATTYAQIIAEELGIPTDDITVEEGDTDTAPYGLGTYASRSTPTAGAAAAMASRKIRDKARKIAAYLLEAREEDLEWQRGRFYVKGSPDKGKTIQDIAFAAYTNHPPGVEAGLEAVDYYDPPNMTFPFGSYICVVDIDRATGEPKVRRFIAVDDCGNIINPLIVDGQIQGGLTMGFGTAFMEEIKYDAEGNVYGGNFMDYLIPSAVETPKWETDKTITPSPHHPLGTKGVGESATVGAPAAFVNAVVDALAQTGVTHIDMPLNPWKIRKALEEKGLAVDA